MKHKAYSPDYKVQENKRKASEIAEKRNNDPGTTVYGYLLIAIVYALLYIGDVIKEK